MTTVLWILGLLGALVVAVFAGQNAEPVQVSFLVWRVTAQLPVVIFISAVLGAVVAAILGAIPLVRTRIRLRRMSADLAQARSAPTTQAASAPEAEGAGAPAAEPDAASPPSLDAAVAEALAEGDKVKPGESA